MSRSMAWRLIKRLGGSTDPTFGIRPMGRPAEHRGSRKVLDTSSTADASTTEIADALAVYPETVHSHVRRVLRKFHARSRTEAIAIADRGARPMTVRGRAALDAPACRPRHPRVRVARVL